MSFYQSPLLNYADRISKVLNKDDQQVNRKQNGQHDLLLLSEMKPLINTLLLPPHLKDPLNPKEVLLHNTKKFTPLDDNLILIGL